MAIDIIDGELFKKAVLSGMAVLRKNADEVNDLNVFPIPDGDTGDNMGSTIYSGVKAIKDLEEKSLAKISKEFAHGSLMGARGNSGVILSQMFAGVAKGFEDKDSADLQDLIFALKEGVKKAYDSVAHPTEGTMLTVLREATDFASVKVNEKSTLKSFANDFVKELNKSLDRTPDLLFCLKEAGVIDSGGKGVCYIAEGIKLALEGKEEKLEEQIATNTNGQKELDFNLFTEDDVMKFGYCTEFLMRLQKSKCNPDDFSVDDLRDWLATIGDSIVAFKTGSIVKVHVHTMTPGKVFEYCQQFGEFLTLKVENMTLQHNESIANDRDPLTVNKKENKAEDKKKPKYKKNFVRKQYGLVAVCSGDGMKQTYKELGTDIIIDGGQCKNPSIDDFIEAFDAVNADDIFVFPNNGNVIMAAENARDMYKNSRIHVIKTKNMGDGYVALSMADFESSNPEDVVKLMNESVESATSAMVTKAVRSTNINNVDIKEGNYIGFSDKTMVCSHENKYQTACELIEKLGINEKDFLIAFYGNGLSQEEKDKFENAVTTKYKNIEFYGIDGGQEVYDYILILQ